MFYVCTVESFHLHFFETNLLEKVNLPIQHTLFFLSDFSKIHKWVQGYISNINIHLVWSIRVYKGTVYIRGALHKILNTLYECSNRWATTVHVSVWKEEGFFLPVCMAQFSWHDAMWAFVNYECTIYEKHWPLLAKHGVLFWYFNCTKSTVSVWRQH